MSFTKIRKNFSIVFLTSFVVGSVASASSIFASNEKDMQPKKDVCITETGNSKVGNVNEEKCVIEKKESRSLSKEEKSEIKELDTDCDFDSIANKDLQNEDQVFNGVKKFVLSLLKNENSAELARKDRGAAWTVAYFYGRLEEKAKQCKGASESEELKMLKKKTGKFLECLYRYIVDIERSKTDSDMLLMTSAASNNYKEAELNSLNSKDGQVSKSGQGIKK